MSPILVVDDREIQAFHWREADARDPSVPRHVRDERLLEEGVSALGAGEVYFECDQTVAFDTTFSLKGDGRKFVIIASSGRRHVAKPY